MLGRLLFNSISTWPSNLLLLPKYWQIQRWARWLADQCARLQWSRPRLSKSRLPMQIKWTITRINILSRILQKYHASGYAKTMFILLETQETILGVQSWWFLYPWVCFMYEWRWYQSPRCWVFSWLYRFKL